MLTNLNINVGESLSFLILLASTVGAIEVIKKFMNKDKTDIYKKLDADNKKIKSLEEFREDAGKRLDKLEDNHKESRNDMSLILQGLHALLENKLHGDNDQEISKVNSELKKHLYDATKR